MDCKAGNGVELSKPPLEPKVELVEMDSSSESWLGHTPGRLVGLEQGADKSLTSGGDKENNGSSSQPSRKRKRASRSDQSLLSNHLLINKLLESSVNVPYSCHRCSFTAARLSSMADHARDVHDLDIVCPECNYYIWSQTKMKKHRSLRHGLGAMKACRADYYSDDSSDQAEVDLPPDEPSPQPSPPLPVGGGSSSSDDEPPPLPLERRAAAAVVKVDYQSQALAEDIVDLAPGKGAAVFSCRPVRVLLKRLRRPCTAPVESVDERPAQETGEKKLAFKRGRRAALAKRPRNSGKQSEAESEVMSIDSSSLETKDFSSDSQLHFNSSTDSPAISCVGEARGDPLGLEVPSKEAVLEVKVEEEVSTAVINEADYIAATGETDARRTNTNVGSAQVAAGRRKANIVFYSCRECPHRSGSLDMMAEHMRSQHSRSVVCNTCGYFTFEPGQLDKHVRNNNHTAEEEAEATTVIEVGQPDSHDQDDDVCVVEDDPLKESEQQQAPPGVSIAIDDTVSRALALAAEKWMACGLCGWACPNAVSLLNHMFDAHNINYLACPFCPEVMVNSLFDVHVAQRHKADGLFLCPICNFTTSIVKCFVRHARVVHKITTSKSLASAECQEPSMTIPQGLDMVSCDFGELSTQLTFKGPEDSMPAEGDQLAGARHRHFGSEHLQNSSGSEDSQNNSYPQKCKVPSCDQLFGSVSSLLFHIHTRHKKNCLACPYCSQVVITSDFKEHLLRMHNSRSFKSFKCPGCNKFFGKIRRFVYHAKKVHCSQTSAKVFRKTINGEISMEKPLEADEPVGPQLPCKFKQCQERFEDRSQLLSHLYSSHHANYTACPYCSQVALSSQFEKHVSRHGGRKGFVCPICFYRTKYSASFVNHTIKFHMDLNSEV